MNDRRPEQPAPADPERDAASEPPAHAGLARRPLEPESDPIPRRPRPRWRRMWGGSRTMETVLLGSTACLLAAVAWPIAMQGLGGGPPAPEPGTPTPTAPVVRPSTDGQPVIQIALLLDTSNSMDGLIDQARSQLWSVVNALDSATYQGDEPRLEIALYEYGNAGLETHDGWIRQVQPFTHELDLVSRALFALSTNGGSEHAGQAVARSIDELKWRDGDNVLRVAYIAGNEEFEQGPVASTSAMAKARAKQVVVNTVFCGAQELGAATGWSNAAALGGGRYMSIDHNFVQTYIAAPQDEEIARLGGELNETYVHYGAQGRIGLENQIAQDGNAEGSGMGSVVTRSVSKSSKHYRNGSWDLVDALEGGEVDLAKVDKSSLPTQLQGKTEAEIEAHVREKRTKRAEIQSRLAELAAAREAFLAAARAEQAGADPQGLDGAIVESIHEQARAAGFTLDEA